MIFKRFWPILQIVTPPPPNLRQFLHSGQAAAYQYYLISCDAHKLFYICDMYKTGNSNFSIWKKVEKFPRCKIWQLEPGSDFIADWKSPRTWESGSSLETSPATFGGFAQFAAKWIDFFSTRNGFLKIVIDENRLGRGDCGVSSDEWQKRGGWPQPHANHFHINIEWWWCHTTVFI